MDKRARPPVETPPPAEDRRKELLVLLLIVALAVLVNAATFSYEFVFDDIGQIVENPYVQSWENVGKFFTMHVWKMLHPVAPGNYYRPIFLLWLLINYSLFGLEPAGWHVTTVLLHVVATVLTYLILRKLTRRSLVASLGALVFAVHPAHLEVTAWVSGTTESLFAVVFFGAFLAYQKSLEKSRILWMLVSSALYAGALLCKEPAFLFPILVFAHRYIYGAPGAEKEVSPGPGFATRLVQGFWAVAPYVPVAVVYLCMRIVALGGFGHATENLPLSWMVLTWPSLLCFYLRILLFPVGLSEFYDFPYYQKIEFAGVLLPALVLVLVVAGLWYWQRRTGSREVRFALVWFFVPLLPTLNLSLFSWRDFAHDRYLYLPSLGFVLLVALALEQLGSGGRQLWGYPARTVYASLVITGLLIAGTLAQSGYWKNDSTMYTRALSIAPEQPTAANNLATVYMKSGKEREAFELYQLVLRVKPDSWYANYNLGYLAYKKGNLQEAEKFFLKCIQLDPFEPDQYAFLGRTRFRMGNLPDAAAALERAIAMKPTALGYHFALGIVFEAGGNCQAARHEFQAELQLNANNPGARQQLEKCGQLLSSR